MHVKKAVDISVADNGNSNSSGRFDITYYAYFFCVSICYKYDGYDRELYFGDKLPVSQEGKWNNDIHVRALHLENFQYEKNAVQNIAK